MATSRQYRMNNLPAQLLQEYPLKDIYYPTINDVLCAKDRTALNHIGNHNWRRLVSLNKHLYLRLPKLQKASVPTSIVMAVRENNPPGRFLRKDKKTNLWYDIGDENAIFKTGQALREDAPRLREEIMKQWDKNKMKHGFGKSGFPIVIARSPPHCNGLDLKSITTHQNIQSSSITNNFFPTVDSQMYTELKTIPPDSPCNPINSCFLNPSNMVPTNNMNIAASKGSSSQTSHSHTNHDENLVKDTDATSISRCADDKKTVINESASHMISLDEHPSSLATGKSTNTKTDHMNIVGSPVPTRKEDTKGIGNIQQPPSPSGGLDLSIMDKPTTIASPRPTTATLSSPFIITHPSPSSSPPRKKNIRTLTTTEGKKRSLPPSNELLPSVTNNLLNKSLLDDNNPQIVPASTTRRRRPTAASPPPIISSSSSLTLCNPAAVDAMIVNQETIRINNNDDEDDKNSTTRRPPIAANIPQSPYHHHHYRPHKKRKRMDNNHMSISLLSTSSLPSHNITQNNITTKHDVLGEIKDADNHRLLSSKEEEVTPITPPSSTVNVTVPVTPPIMIPEISSHTTVSLSSSPSIIPDAAPSSAAIQCFMNDNSSAEMMMMPTSSSSTYKNSISTSDKSSSMGSTLSTLLPPPCHNNSGESSAIFRSLSSLMMNDYLRPSSPSSSSLSLLRQRSVILSLLGSIRGHTR